MYWKKKEQITRYIFTFSPRPYYPKSWLWTEEEAALHIQRYVRGWLVRKQAEVQEMRQFWKVEISIYRKSHLLIYSVINYRLHPKEIAGRVFDKGTCIVQLQRVSGSYFNNEVAVTMTVMCLINF